MEPGHKERKICHQTITPKKQKSKRRKLNAGTLLTIVTNKRRATKQSKCEKIEGEEMKKRSSRRESMANGREKAGKSESEKGKRR